MDTTAMMPTGKEPVPVYVVFDTETTGLFQFKDKATGMPIAADAPGQPRMASFAAIITDEHGTEITRYKHFIRPDGWSIDGTEAARINGLSDAFLMEHGIPVADVLAIWNGYIDGNLISTAFNAQFDTKVMRAELRRAGLPDRFEDTKNSCLMKSLEPYGKEGMPIARGYIKLAEACEWLGIKRRQAHDAMSDTEDARSILEILLHDGRLLPPKIHYAKARA